jgi:hypothetical protein
LRLLFPHAGFRGNRVLHNLKALAAAGLICVTAVIAGCGGGGSSTPAPVTTAPSGLSYPAPPVLVVGSAITPLTPTVTGSVTSYSVTPALPAGLTLNTSTGAISGTPTAVAATAPHTITARNSGGSTTADVSITVKDVPPSIDYGSEEFRFTTDVPLTPVVPTSSGGAAVSWSIHPALPAGLVFGETDGRITGTPGALADPQSYLVTATNSGGTSQATLTISVESGVLLELGHADSIDLLRLTATRALSRDTRAHWVLWNLATAEIVAQGEGACEPIGCNEGRLPVDLAGATVVIQTSAGLEIRAAADGRILATVPGEISSWKLASDGTYVVVANATALRAWTSAGDLLFTRSGNYSSALAFAVPAEVRVGHGAAGANVIEQIAVPSGVTTTSSPFAGTFHSWFLDGARFFTNVAATVRVYSAAAVQQDLAALPELTGLTGQGNWFWVERNPGSHLDVYAVGASTTPAATYPGLSSTVSASGTQLAVLTGGEGQVRIVDLSGATPASQEYVVPPCPRAFGINATGTWLLGNCSGVLLDGATLAGTVKYFGYGAAWSVAGSDTRIAIATASRGILHFDASTKALEGTIPFSASHIELSSDGALLAAAANVNYGQYSPDRSLNIYALPAETIIDARPYTYDGTPSLRQMSLARSGDFVAEILAESGTITRQVTPVGGGSPTFSDSGSGSLFVEERFQLSPDGTRVAISTVGPVTNIYENGSLVSAVPGQVVDWIDQDRLLVNDYVGEDNHYGSATISDVSAATLGTPALPELMTLQPVTADTVYSPGQNSIFSLVTGAAIWTGSRPASRSKVLLEDLGAVAGPWVVFASGAQVRIEPH